MKTIKELTKEQRDSFPIWVEKWKKIGLQVGEADFEKFEKNIKICYQKAGLKVPKKIIRVQSPIVGAVASSMANSILGGVAVHDAVEVAVRVAVGGAVRDAVHDAVEVAVRDAVGGTVDVAVGGTLRDAVGGTLRVAVGGTVGVALRVAVDGDVCDAVGGAVGDAMGVDVDGVVDGAVRGATKNLKWHTWLGGQFWVGGWWGSPSYVSFFTDVCGLELSQDIKERADAYRGICESANYIWCNSDFIMVCNRPKNIFLNEKGQLHKDGAKAIEYNDGWGLYMLNGVQVPEYLAITPESKLNIAWYLEQKNADVKAEFVRKFGVERMLNYGVKIDDYTKYKNQMWFESEYELWDMQNLFDGLTYAPYLKMRNQTTGIWHVEAVSPECRTIEQALQFRFGGRKLNIIGIK